MTDTAADTGSASPTYTRVLRARGFPGLLTMWTLTITATSLQVMALSVLVYDSTGSATLASTTFAAGFLPQVVGGFTLTSLADRWSPRVLLAGGAALRAAAAFILAAAPLPTAAVIAVVALVATTSPLFTGVQSATAARILPPESYVLGRSMLTMAASGAQLGGLAVGGALVSLCGARPALLVCAGAFCLVVLLVPTTLRDQLDREPGADHEASSPVARWRWSDSWRTNRRLLARPQVRSLLFLFWVPPTLFVAGESLMVPYADQLRAPHQLGLLLAAFPAGALIGDVVVGRWCREGAQRRLVAPLVCLMGVGLATALLQPPGLVSVALFTLGSAGLAYQLGRQRDFLDAVPDGQQGQAFGLLSTGTMTGQGVGPVAAGLLADRIGASAAVAAAGTILVGYGLTLVAREWHAACGPARPVAASERPHTRST
ncbi:MFS transporter [Nocardioides acrostichi]|uniref:MFS transporter n=1 Tax=Nocardioides acrostichi TaxID=2784339 RepID=A0A930UYN5_9ACTN|nr:MFS transporter [Nocardioides acrostichi]MBF4160814.1 MFS transporter [Nocardioides acrostichi]